MNRQRSFSSRAVSSKQREVSPPLQSLVESLLQTLFLLKEETESVDDTLFDLQTRTTEALDGPSRHLQRLARLTECFSFCLFSCQKKIEELSVFESFSRIEEQILDAGVSRRSGAGTSGVEEVSLFLRSAVWSTPVFVACFSSVFPSSAPMIDLVCTDVDLGKLACDFVANYHVSDVKAALPLPHLLFSGLFQRCAARGVQCDRGVLEQMIYPLIQSVCRERTSKVSIDRQFNATCELLSRATQSHFSIRLQLQDKNAREPWAQAIRLLHSISHLATPSQLLDAIFDVAKSIYHTAQEKKVELAADDFMDVLCFVVFKASAKIRSLNSIANFVETFAGDECDAEKNYYFTCVQLAIAFVKDLSWNSAERAANLVRVGATKLTKTLKTHLVVEKEAFLARFVNVRNPLVSTHRSVI
jgi:hypothetical protein